MADSSQVRELLEDLAGQPAPFRDRLPELPHLDAFLAGRTALGYSQLNELLLLLGFDRVTHAFFQYLVNGSTEYQPGSSIGSLEDLRSGVDRFRQTAILLYGNVKYAFKLLSRDRAELDAQLLTLQPVDRSTFIRRNPPIFPIERVPAEDSYLLGYMIERDLRARLKQNPEDAGALALEERRRAAVEVGKRNHVAYLASDDLDVYVATSMRLRHEYLLMSETTQRIFGDPRLAPLNLRWFDPTQAYCADRIDKGLSEALMLKRAKCTVYFAQESDTFGKDSELATTLAQGKIVIAFVPLVDATYVESLLELLYRAYPERSEPELLLEQLQVFDPMGAWTDAEVARWSERPAAMPVAAATARLGAKISEHYDKRADMLRTTHPLGIQVNLETGVANGVLVARTTRQCAGLIERAVTRTLAFDLESRSIGDHEYQFLVERDSQCVFRVVSGDAMLTNAFWNFYLDPSE